MSLTAQNVLDSDPFGFGRFVNTPERKVVILWDYESCPVPNGVSGLSVVRNIREAALKFGSIDQFEAYSHWSNDPNTSIKNDLSLSGIKLRDCPHTGKKAAVSKTMVIDMMVYALERPRSTTVVLISSDRDYAYGISMLRNRGYPVKLLAPSGYLHPGLQLLADVLDWNSIFRPDLPPSELIDFTGLPGAEDEEEESDEDEEETDEEEEESDEEEEDEEQEEEEKDEAELLKFRGQSEAKVDMEPGMVVKDEEPGHMAKDIEAGKVVKDVEVEEVQQLEAETELLVEAVKEEGKQGASEVQPGPFEFKSSPPPSPTWSDPAPLPAPAAIPPTWGSAQPAPPAVVVPLEPLSARLPQPAQKPQPPPVPSPAPPAQPQTAPPSYASGSSRPGTGEPLLEQPARYIPPKFLALVEELDVMRSEGQTAPLWSAVCIRVYKRLPSVLTKAGVKKWKDYMLLAQEEGIVNLKLGRPGNETVSLKI